MIGFCLAFFIFIFVVILSVIFSTLVPLGIFVVFLFLYLSINILISSYNKIDDEDDFETNESNKINEKIVKNTNESFEFSNLDRINNVVNESKNDKILDLLTPLNNKFDDETKFETNDSNEQNEKVVKNTKEPFDSDDTNSINNTVAEIKVNKFLDFKIFNKFFKYFRNILIVEFCYFFILFLCGITNSIENDDNSAIFGVLLFSFLIYVILSWLSVLLIPSIIRILLNRAVKKTPSKLYCVIFSILTFFLVFASLVQGNIYSIFYILHPVKFFAVYQYMIAGGIEEENKENKGSMEKIKFNLKKYFENKKLVYAILCVILFCVIYQIFFRYEYKIYEGKYSRGYVVKLDRLTGKATQEYAEKR